MGGTIGWSSSSVITLENFQNDLKLPLAGTRSRRYGGLSSQNAYGYYWSSTPTGARGHFLRFNNISIAYFPEANTGRRAYGHSVRCFKNKNL
ncbi:MAG: fibrobacter succinogenes major paralogous domain-containing protein [Candidatus Peribacteria bacterium]|nr:fibrobacter succinogenes major paralogous domain-containing protein [Candidatus Peribacteria bacterium]